MARTALPVLNEALLDRIHDFIMEHPEVHEQESYYFYDEERPLVTTPSGRSVCGTAACFAGWAVLDANPRAVLVRERGQYGETYLVDKKFATRAGYLKSGVEPWHDGVQVDCHEEARRLLGLTRKEARRLFYGLNTRENLTDMVKQIKAARARGEETTFLSDSAMSEF